MNRIESWPRLASQSLLGNRSHQFGNLQGESHVLGKAITCIQTLTQRRDPNFVDDSDDDEDDDWDSIVIVDKTSRGGSRSSPFGNNNNPFGDINDPTNNDPSSSNASSDKLIIMSSGMDGTIRVWDSIFGNEEYRLDGFEEDTVIHLCLRSCEQAAGGGEEELDETLLVTDGMKQNVCIHDFNPNQVKYGRDKYEYDMDDDNKNGSGGFGGNNFEGEDDDDVEDWF